MNIMRYSLFFVQNFWTLQSSTPEIVLPATNKSVKLELFEILIIVSRIKRETLRHSRGDINLIRRISRSPSGHYLIFKLNINSLVGYFKV
jgi:hypothetical protein